MKTRSIRTGRGGVSGGASSRGGGAGLGGGRGAEEVGKKMSHFGSAGPPDIRDTHSLLVLNITFRTSADDLYPLFDRYGKVVDIFIPRDRRTGESRGFAFVRYKYAEEAQKAIERLDGRNVDGRDMVVQYAKYGRDMETIHRGKITTGSPSKWSSRSRSRSPRRASRPRSPIRGGKRNFGPPSQPYPSPPRGRDRYPGPPPPRHRDEYREREREYRHRSRSRDRYERTERYRERERDHRRRSPSRSPSRSRSRSRGRAEYERKPVERDASPPARSRSPERSVSRSFSGSPRDRRSAEPVKEDLSGDLSPLDRKRTNSESPKQSSLSPANERGLSPARKSLSPVEREESLSPVRSASPVPRRSLSPVQRSVSRSPSPRRHTASLTPEPQSPFQD